MSANAGFKRVATRSFSLLGAGLTLSAVLGFSSPAEACGGFWCSQAAPVNQTAEQIIFADNADDTVTCVVQISYAGPSENFAWLLPVAGVPVLGVSSNVAFQRLSQATQPQFVLERHVEGECNPNYVFDYAAEGCAGCSFASPPTATDSGVQVLAQGSVGPYDYAVIQVDRTLPSPADAAINWLTTNGYDVADVSSSVLGPYLADGLNIVAMKLTKGNDTGSIRPVVITYPGDKPSIPIRPTAVAAENDMGVLVWVLSEHQAVPQNYRSLILNEALINWFNPLSNYDQVVTAAANEAGGQGFVTELAAPSTTYETTVYGTYEAQGWAEIQQQTYADPIDLIWAANNYFRGWDGWREAIEESVTLPAGVTIDQFAQNPDSFRGMPGVSVDAALFKDLLYTTVILPVLQTQELINSRPYMTRLYSTMSPDEMTLDPVFTFNPDLAPISNVHTADLFIECNPDIYEWEAPWRIVLPQGGTLYGTGQSSWPLTLDSMPANFKIVQLSESGSGDVIENSSVPIAMTLVDLGGTYSGPTASPPPPEEGMPIGGYDEPVVLPGNDASASGGGCGCTIPGAEERTSRGAALAMVAFGMTIAVRRRSERRRAKR